MTRKRRIALAFLGVFVILGASLALFAAVSARPMLSPELRRQDAMETLAARGVASIRSFAAPFEGTTVGGVEVGDPGARAVVFVHGSPGDWTDFVELLGDADLRSRTRLVSIDRLGFGASDFGRPEPSMARQAAAVVAAMDYLAIERAVLVGHSLGGPVVARAAMDFPARVAAIVPVGSSADPALEKTPWYQRVGNWPIVRPLLPTMIDVCNREILPHAGELAAMEPRWSAIACPVVIVHGVDDVLVPVANVDFMAARVREDVLTLRVYDDMNHFVPWSHPDRLREAIDAALEASEPAR